MRKLLVSTTIIALPFVAAAQPGNLDQTFNSTGKLSTVIGVGNYSFAYATVLQPDGKILVAGQTVTSATSNYDIAVVRYNANGSLDGGFGTGGKVTTAGITNGADVAYAIALQSDGKIVVAGSTMNANSDKEFAVLRYNSNGTLDNTFGTNGKVTTNLSNDQSIAQSICIQPDGKILVSGSVRTVNQYYKFGIARYTSAGVLDNTFGSGGKALLDFGRETYANCMALQADGKVLMGGRYASNVTGSDFCMARFNANGTIDNNFGTSGKVTTAGGYDLTSLYVLPNGKILAGGQKATGPTVMDMALFRYNANGTLDNNFGITGKYSLDVAGADDCARSIMVQSDSKILLGGYASVNGAYRFALARVKPNGITDSTFGSNGVVTTAFGNINDQAQAMLMQPDNKVVLAGYTVSNATNGNADFAVSRYELGPMVPSAVGESPLVISAARLWPNPAADEIWLQVVMNQTSTLRVTLSDTKGQIVWRSDYGTLYAGNHKFRLPVHDLVPGLYQLLIETDHNDRAILQFIKAN